MTTKQELIDHFVSVGIPKFVAKRMAKLTTLDDHQLAVECTSASACISFFTAWVGTREGHAFWQAIHEHFAAQEVKT